MNINFKGLWGEADITRKTFINSNKTDYNKTNIYNVKRHYYPFLDETDKEINFVLKENNVKYKQFNHDTFEHTQVNSTCYVDERLPITKQEFKDYKANRINPVTALDIEDTLQLFALEKYLNKNED